MSAHGENRRNLQDAVSVNTADRIFDELRRNGAYKSWSDLADRVTGIGVKKIKKMEKSILIGEILAKRAKEKNINQVYFDRGQNKYHGRVKNFAESLRKNGLKF